MRRLISLFALPLLWGLGASAGYNFLYYPLVVIILAALALAAASLSSLVVMGIARIFPARRVVEVIGFVVGISSLVCSQSSNLFRFNHASTQQLGPILQQLTPLNSLWSPLSWAGQGLVRFGEGSFLAGGGLLLLALSVTGAVFYGALTTAERLYYSGWARMQASSRSKKSMPAPSVKQNTDRASPNLFTWVPLPIQAIITKDFRMLRRDLRQEIHSLGLTHGCKN